MLACDDEYKCSISTWMYACGADQLLVGKIEIEKVAKNKEIGGRGRSRVCARG